MAYKIQFSTAASDYIEAALCERIGQIRLLRNLTQKQLAEEAGVSLRTIGRLEKGEGVSLETFIRVLIALRIQQSLEGLLPDPSIRPVERVMSGGKERQRARPKPSTETNQEWTWADDD